MAERQVTQVQAWETTAAEAQSVMLREDVLEEIVASVRAAFLTPAEFSTLVAALHGLMAVQETEKASVTVTATATRGGKVSSASVVRECSAPSLVAETVDLLVRAASPELWASIRAVLEASDSELAAMVAVAHRAP